MTTVETEIRDGVDRETVETVQSVGERYKHGWSTDIEMEFAPKGLNPDIVRLISDKNGEPGWMTEWRLAAYARWTEMTRTRNGRWSTIRPSTIRNSIITPSRRA
jgi:Fe-S cluster assembly protein SufB